MDTSRLRTIGVQTSICTINASTQTTCFDAIHGYAENLADWVITEAFKYGRNLDKFASCIVDCILMEVFMAKSLRNLASYMEECSEAEKPYPPLLADSETIEQLVASFPILPTASCEPARNGFDCGDQSGFCVGDYSCRSELNSSLSNPDPLQMLEDDIIRCLQTLTDDEEELISACPNSDCLSDNSAANQQLSSQISELDSGFLSSEDALSVDQRGWNTKKPRLPSLTEELDECFKFKWPRTPEVRGKSENCESSAQISRAWTPSREPPDDPVTERQKLLRGLLVRELKASVEGRRKKIEKDEENEDVDVPSRPIFKAQATKSVWMPGPTLSTSLQEYPQTIESSFITRLENLDCTENKNENSAKYQKTFLEENPCTEDLSTSSRGLNGLSKIGTNEDIRNTQKTSCSSEPSQNSDQIDLTCFGANEKQVQNAVVVDQKVTVENDEIHTDTYYAAPIQEITTINRVIKAPTYDGIGPTENGVPIGLRTGIQKEYSSDWYRTMFKSLHRQDKPEEKKFVSDGYMSDPELIRKEKPQLIVDNRGHPHVISNGSHHASTANNTKNVLNHPFPAAKSSYRPYNHKPWIISDYEPGYSSIADTEAPYENKRHLPPLISPKPKYVCNDGYESDSTLIRKTGKIHEFNPQEQKQWYQEIQRGGDIPIHGLGKPAPEKMKEPIVGPPPPVPVNWDADHYYNIYSTTLTDPERNDGLMMSIRDQNVNNYSQDKLPKLQDDFRSKLDEVLLSQQEDNLRHSPRKSPISSSQQNPKSLSTSPSSSPVCPFKVTVLYDFEAQTSRELSLKKGDIVNVRRKIDKNWLEGEHCGVVGILPNSYVEPVSTKSSSKITTKVIDGSARAKFDFVAQNSVELSLHKDDAVTLLRQVDGNWYEGSLNGKTGIFPICYVEVISEPQHAVASSQASTPSSIKNQKTSSKEEPDLHPSEAYSKQVSPDIDNGNEAGKKNKTIIHNHEGNKVIPYKSIYAYRPQNDDELELREGDVIYVVEKCDDGWFVGTSMRTGLFGTFPGNYVEKI